MAIVDYTLLQFYGSCNARFQEQYLVIEPGVNHGNK